MVSLIGAVQITHALNHARALLSAGLENLLKGRLGGCVPAHVYETFICMSGGMSPY